MTRGQSVPLRITRRVWIWVGKYATYNKNVNSRIEIFQRVTRGRGGAANLLRKYHGGKNENVVQYQYGVAPSFLAKNLPATLLITY